MSLNRNECHAIYDELVTLRPTQGSSWRRLRELIKRLKYIAHKFDVSAYDINLNGYYKATCIDGENCDKERFMDICKELRDTVRNLSAHISD